MTRSARVIGAVPGILFLLSGLGWLVSPDTAAQNIGLPAPSSLDGIARSSLIGDVGAFFLGGATMSLIGALSGRRAWLQSAALLIGLAAVMRTLAWLVHDAVFAPQFVLVEVVLAATLLYAASRAEA